MKSCRPDALEGLKRKYGYPPDMQELATETVIKQAEMIADELMQALY
jgi:type I restriction enzyme R subunit